MTSDLKKEIFQIEKENSYKFNIYIKLFPIFFEKTDNFKIYITFQFMYILCNNFIFR